MSNGSFLKKRKRDLFFIKTLLNYCNEGVKNGSKRCQICEMHSALTGEKMLDENVDFVLVARAEAQNYDTAYDESGICFKTGSDEAAGTEAADRRSRDIPGDQCDGDISRSVRPEKSQRLFDLCGDPDGRVGRDGTDHTISHQERGRALFTQMPGLRQTHHLAGTGVGDGEFRLSFLQGKSD
jgi:hypothetical protein